MGLTYKALGFFLSNNWALRPQHLKHSGAVKSVDMLLLLMPGIVSRMVLYTAPTKLYTPY